MAALLLMGLASIMGALCSLNVYLLLRRANRRSAKVCLAAALFPPAVVGYLLGCLILSSMLSGPPRTPDLVFGDINEQLPNGFTRAHGRCSGLRIGRGASRFIGDKRPFHFHGLLSRAPLSWQANFGCALPLACCCPANRMGRIARFQTSSDLEVALKERRGLAIVD
jgi:hypothetical protein